MATVTAALVKELRERTGLGMMDCKKALTETDGDMTLAIENLRKSSGMKAAKKAGRTASEGRVALRSSGDTLVLVEVNSETDFAAKHEDFIDFVEHVSDFVLERKTTDIDALLAAGLEDKRQALVQKIGENISVRRAELIARGSDTVSTYVHGNGKIGVIVVLTGGDDDLGRDIAMHVAATNPMALRGEDMDQSVLAAEREIYLAQAADSGKPKEIMEKMVEGRIRKFLQENALVDQPFVKDPDQKIGQLLKSKGADISRFVRYEVGEGIEKEEVDFAEEVKRQARGNDDKK